MKVVRFCPQYAPTSWQHIAGGAEKQKVGRLDIKPGGSRQ